MLDARRVGVLHLLLGSLAWVLGVLLVAVAAETGVRLALREQKDRRRMHQQRFLGMLAVRLAAGLVILLIVFGTPSQTPTIIGLATAGLTVASEGFPAGVPGVVPADGTQRSARGGLGGDQGCGR